MVEGTLGLFRCKGQAPGLRHGMPNRGVSLFSGPTSGRVDLGGYQPRDPDPESTLGAFFPTRVLTLVFAGHCFHSLGYPVPWHLEQDSLVVVEVQGRGGREG